AGSLDHGAVGQNEDRSGFRRIPWPRLMGHLALQKRHGRSPIANSQGLHGMGIKAISPSRRHITSLSPRCNGGREGREFTMRRKLTEAMQAAQKARDSERLATLRLILAAIKDRDIAHRGAGKEPVSDAD